MSREPFEAMPDVMDAKQLAEALQISKAGAYNLLSSPDFPTLRIGGRKLVMKNELVEWLKSRTNACAIFAAQPVQAATIIRDSDKQATSQNKQTTNTTQNPQAGNDPHFLH